MFALGTYTLNTSDDGHSDLATSIDHTTAMTLLNMVNDGSPIVRKVSRQTARNVRNGSVLGVMMEEYTYYCYRPFTIMM